MATTRRSISNRPPTGAGIAGSVAHWFEQEAAAVRAWWNPAPEPKDACTVEGIGEFAKVTCVPLDRAPVTQGFVGITSEQLRQVMPQLFKRKHVDPEVFVRGLNTAMQEADINTPQRQAFFLGQLAHESGEFRWMQELADGSDYDPAVNPKKAARLGNTEIGDGARYKGRGPIQLTGRRNYRVAGLALGIDLENNPELAADPAIGLRVAAWYWTTHHLNRPADAGDLIRVTKGINGGVNGLSDREKYTNRATRALSPR